MIFSYRFLLPFSFDNDGPVFHFEQKHLGKKIQSSSFSLPTTSVTRLGDFCTLDNFLKAVATIILPKSPAHIIMQFL